MRSRSRSWPPNRLSGRWTILRPNRRASRRQDAGGILRADDRDVPVAAVQERRGEQPLFQGVGEVEPRVDPDVGDRPGREEEQGTAVLGLGDPRTDQVLHGVGGVEGERRFLGVLGVPGRAIGVDLGVGGDCRTGRRRPRSSPRLGGTTLT